MMILSKKHCWSRLLSSRHLREYPSSLCVRPMSSLRTEEASSKSSNWINHDIMLFVNHYGGVIATIGGFCALYSLLKTDIRRDFRAEINTIHTNLKAQISTIDTNLEADIGMVGTNLKSEINTINTNLKAEINTINTNFDADIDMVGTGLKADIKNLELDINANITQQTDRILEFLAAKGESQDDSTEGMRNDFGDNEKSIWEDTGK